MISCFISVYVINKYRTLLLWIKYIVGLAVVGFAVVGLAVVGLAVVGLAVVGSRASSSARS